MSDVYLRYLIILFKKLMLVAPNVFAFVERRRRMMQQRRVLSVQSKISLHGQSGTIQKTHFPEEVEGPQCNVAG